MQPNSKCCESHRAFRALEELQGSDPSAETYHSRFMAARNALELGDTMHRRYFEARIRKTAVTHAQRDSESGG